MDYGAHLPLIDFTGEGTSLKQIIDYSETAERLGYTTLCANDHLLFPRPWMDGPTALAFEGAKFLVHPHFCQRDDIFDRIG